MPRIHPSGSAPRLLMLTLLVPMVICGAETVVDLAIVGAGWSGLVAAHTVALHNNRRPLEQRLTFHILEATDHVGGRTLNVDVRSGQTGSVNRETVAELGGEWLAPEHLAAIQLINKTLGFRLFHRLYNAERASDALKIVVNTAQGTQYCDTAKEIKELLSNPVRAQVEQVTARFKDLAMQIPCNGPLPAGATSMDGISFDNWAMQQGATSQEARNWLSEYADDAEATNAMSLFGVGWTYNCSNRLVGAYDEDQFRVENGTQGPALALASTMMGNISLNSPVTHIEQLSSGMTRVSSSGASLLARNVLIAGLSPPVYAAIQQQPPLPGDEFQLLSRLPLGTSLKYMVVYPEPWWRKQGFLGKVVNTVYEIGNQTQYISECLDNSPGNWEYGVLMCFIEGPQNRAFFHDLPTKEQRQDHVVNFIATHLKNETAAAGVLRSFEHNWADFPFTRGAYSPFFSPGVLSGFWDTWMSLRAHNGSRAMQRLWIAGSDYSGNGFGYIDGAITSGREAAKLIIERTAQERN